MAGFYPELDSWKAIEAVQPDIYFLAFQLWKLSSRLPAQSHHFLSVFSKVIEVYL